MIVFNYQEAMDQVRALRQASNDLQRLVNNNLDRETADLSVAWQGEAADIYFKKIQKLNGDIAETAKSLSAIAGAVETAAKAIKRAEDAAKELVGAGSS